MANFYIIYGENELAVKKRAVALAKEFANIDSENNSEDNLSSDHCSTEIILGDNMSLEAVVNSLISELQTPPFLTAQKTVFLRYFKDIEKLLNPNNKLGEQLLETLLNHDYDENINLIIESPEGTLDLRKANNKKIKNIAILESFNNLKLSDRKYQELKSEIIRENVAKNGKKISHDALRFLCEALPNDTGVMENEIEKLTIYLGEEVNISLDVCQKVCAKTPESLIYLFTNSLMEKNLSSSIKLLDVLIDNGEVEMKIMAAIASEVQKIVQTRLAMEELQVQNNLNPRTFDNIDAALKLKYPNNFLLSQHPFRAFKLCEAALAWNKENIAYALKVASEANLAIVSGKMAPRTVLEQLIFAICQNK
jgi:DNA polymerase-3 subunit delta